MPAWWPEPAGDGLSADRGGLADGVVGETRLVLDRLDELFGATEGADKQEAELLLTSVVATGGVAQVLAHVPMIAPKRWLVCTASIRLGLWPTGVLAFRQAGGPAA